jgi:hypothetical protein
MQLKMKKEKMKMKTANIKAFLIITAVCGISATTMATDETIDGNLKVSGNFEQGNSAASGHRAFAIGGDCEASGYYSYAKGRESFSYGFYSHVDGDHCSSSGAFSHAQGANCKAYGDYSRASGANATADHDFSYVWSSGQTFSSSTNQQFSVYAENGINLETGPQASVTVNGVVMGQRFIQQVWTTNEASFQANDWTDISGLAVTVTPHSASSDVLVKGMIAGSSGNGAKIRLVQNGSPVVPYIAYIKKGYDYDTDEYGSYFDEYDVVAPVSFEILDAPASLSPIIYKVQVLSSGGAFTLNSIDNTGPFLSNLIVEEIMK